MTRSIAALVVTGGLVLAAPASAHPSYEVAYAQGISNLANAARGDGLRVTSISRHRVNARGRHFRLVRGGWVEGNAWRPAWTWVYPGRRGPYTVKTGPLR